MANTNDLIVSKLAQRYPSEGKTLGDLLRRYRIDQNLSTWESYRDHVTHSCLEATGLNDGNISTPDHASFAWGAAIDVRILMGIQHLNWQNFFTQHWVRQWPGAPNNAWVFSIHINGRMRLGISTNGTNLFGPECTVDTPFLGLQAPTWLRATCSIAGGTGTYNYFTSADGTNWAPLGAQDLTEGGHGATIFNSTAVMDCPGGVGFPTRVYYAEVRSSIGGTIVTNPDFRTATPGAASLNDSTGKTWTLSGTSSFTEAPLPVGDMENAFWDAFVP